MSHQSGVNQHKPEQTSADHGKAKQTGKEQSRAVQLERGLRALLFPQLYCFTVELFALNKVSFFTAPQIGDSSWH